MIVNLIQEGPRNRSKQKEELGLVIRGDMSRSFASHFLVHINFLFFLFSFIGNNGRSLIMVE